MTSEMIETLQARWTTGMVEAMPRVAGERYEIIDGELYVTTQPHYRHQLAAQRIAFVLEMWNQAGHNGIVIPAPGLVYASDEAVAPDLVWISKARIASIIGPDGKLHESPDLVIEILSPGKANEERDRDMKLALYARHGVPEYWIADWRATTLDIYRLDGESLRLVQTLGPGETLTSPLLPGFACVIDRFFEL